MFASCGNADNAVDEIIENSGITEEEISSFLAAVENGEKFTINFTYRGDAYYATFKKTGDNAYEFDEDASLLPGAATTRTRAYGPSFVVTLTYVNGNLVFDLLETNTNNVYLRVIFDAENDSYEIIARQDLQLDFTNLKIDGAVADGITATTQKVALTDGTRESVIYYRPGETWEQLINRSKNALGGFSLLLNGNTNTVYLVGGYNLLYNQEDDESVVHENDEVGKNSTGDADVSTYYLYQNED